MSNLDDIITSDIQVNINDKKCAPGQFFYSGSCIRLSILIEMVNAYNKDIGETNGIKLNRNLEILNPGKYKKYLITEFNKRLGDKCSTQKCWTQQNFINNMRSIAQTELKKFTFRPNGPAGKFKWLSTVNILEVMSQYENQYPEFKYLGTVPLDFESLDHTGLRDIDFSNLVRNNKTKLGMVINLDPSYEPGSHWVGLYSDLNNGYIYFFDSYGIPPEKEIRSFMRKIANFVETKMNIQPIVDSNKIRHQYKKSECGVYSINFIDRMLKGETFEQICQSRIPDEDINKMRTVYFNNVNF